MKAILEFNLPDDESTFKMMNQAKDMHNILWELDQYLRSLIKYAPDGTSSDTLDAYQNVRNSLRELMSENNVTFDDV